MTSPEKLQPKSEKEADVIPLPVEWHGEGRLMEGETRDSGLRRLNFVDRELEVIDEELQIMEGGLSAAKDFNQEIKESLGKKVIRKTQNFIMKRAHRDDLLREPIPPLEDLDLQTKKEIQEEKGKLEQKREELVREKAKLQSWLYTPDKLKEIHELERSLGRKLVEATPEIRKGNKKEALAVNEKLGFEMFLHEKQKNSFIQGFKLDKYLKETGLIDRTLSLEDELVKKWIENPETYPEELKRKYPFLWKSQRDVGRDRYVACLYWRSDRVRVSWLWLGGACRERDPVLLASSF